LGEVTDVLLQALPGAIGGLVTGAIASLIAPWVQWAIEKRRSKLNYRQELIRKWRKEIEDLALALLDEVARIEKQWGLV
jgi:hypothetical protein